MPKRKRRVDFAKPVEAPRMPVAVAIRMFLIGAIGVVGAGYAIYRHYYVARPSMLMPVPAATFEVDPSGSFLVPVPDLVAEPPASSPPPAPSR